ncbi:MAG: hypothetical protein QI197_05490 [Candidatus Korarchaeota archaeon]|nr:hypothetical protein [Candidatus Korarchaeota archaeon]
MVHHAVGGAFSGMLGFILAALLSIAAQAFYFWVAQIFVMEERKGFFSLMGLVVTGNFLSGLAYLTVVRVVTIHPLPLPSLFGVASVLLVWTLVAKYWYDTSWVRAFLLILIASLLQLLTIYVVTPESWGMRPFRELGL